MKTLYTVNSGSNLYGTNTPTSDLDLKSIILPSFRNILLGYQQKITSSSSNNAFGQKNNENDVDEEFIPITRFTRDYYNGQTYALEIANSLSHNSATIVDQSFKFFVEELQSKFSTSNIKAMLGYAINQACVYSNKGSRYYAVAEFHEILMQCTNSETDLLETMSDENYLTFKELETSKPKYFKINTYNSGTLNNVIMYPCFRILDKIIPLNVSRKTASVVSNALLNKYGDRSKASKAGTDWKAYMHAIRIVRMGKEYLQAGRIMFPLDKETVDYLLKIKHGEVSIDLISEELETGIDELKNLEESCKFQKQSPELEQKLEDWLYGWMRLFYKDKD